MQKLAQISGVLRGAASAAFRKWVVGHGARGCVRERRCDGRGSGGSDFATFRLFGRGKGHHETNWAGGEADASAFREVFQRIMEELVAFALEDDLKRSRLHGKLPHSGLEVGLVFHSAVTGEIQDGTWRIIVGYVGPLLKGGEEPVVDELERVHATRCGGAQVPIAGNVLL